MLFVLQTAKNSWRNSATIWIDTFYVLCTSTDYMSLKLNSGLGVWITHRTGKKLIKFPQKANSSIFILSNFSE
jgi:hypothetical protein